MEVKDKYIRKYWVQILSDQIYDEYVAKGYNVKKRKSIGDFRADVVAEKDDHKLLFEIVLDDRPDDYYVRIRKVAQEYGYLFILVAANYSSFKQQIYFEDFEEIFEQYLNSNLPSEIDEVGTHCRVEEVSDVTFKCIHVADSCIDVNGQCMLKISSSFDNEGDSAAYYNFPCSFGVTCELSGGDIEIIDEHQMDIDNSSFYE